VHLQPTFAHTSLEYVAEQDALLPIQPTSSEHNASHDDIFMSFASPPLPIEEASHFDAFAAFALPEARQTQDIPHRSELSLLSASPVEQTRASEDNLFLVVDEQIETAPEHIAMKGLSGRIPPQREQGSSRSPSRVDSRADNKSISSPPSLEPGCQIQAQREDASVQANLFAPSSIEQPSHSVDAISSTSLTPLPNQQILCKTSTTTLAAQQYMPLDSRVDHVGWSAQDLSNDNTSEHALHSMERPGYELVNSISFAQARPVADKSCELRDGDVDDKLTDFNDDELGLLRAEVKRLTNERASALANASRLQLTLDERVFKESHLDAECARLRADLKRSAHAHDALLKAHERALLQNQQQSRPRYSAPDGTSSTDMSDTRGELAALRSDLTLARELAEVEGRRADTLASQVMSSEVSVRDITEQRNALLDDRTSWMAYQSDVVEQGRASDAKRLEAECRANSVASERDAALEQCVLLSEQLKVQGLQLAAVTADQESLVRQRSADAAQSVQMLEEDREAKTLSLHTLQRQLATAMSKIEKLSGQRRLCLKQRDDAGARLRAAGAEFQSIQQSEQAALAERAKFCQDASRLTREQDEFRTQIAALTEKAAHSTTLEATCDRLRADVRVSNTKNDELESAQLELIERISKSESAATGFKEHALLLANELEDVKHHASSLEIALEAKSAEVIALHSSVIEAKQLHADSEVDLVGLRDASDRSALQAANALKLCEKKYAMSQTEIGNLRHLQAQLEDKVSSKCKVLWDSIQASQEQCEECDRSSGLSAGILPSFAGRTSSHKLIDAGGADSFEEEMDVVVCRAVEVLHRFMSKCQQLRADLVAAQTISQETKASLEKLAKQEAGNSIKLAQMSGDLDAARQAQVACESERNELSSALSCLKVERVHAEERALTATKEFDQLHYEFSLVRSELDSVWDIVHTFQPWHSAERVVENVRYESIVDAVTAILADLMDGRKAVDERNVELTAAQFDLDALVERAETAEEELQSARRAVDQLKRASDSEREHGETQLKSEYEQIVTSLEEEIRRSKQEVSEISTAKSRLETEFETSRQLCSKLTAQFNSRTNELDDAEEKVAYLQEQVATLEEDLEDARHSSQTHALETAEARRSEAGMLSAAHAKELERAKQLELSLVELRSDLDRAQEASDEARLVAETHRQAEANLQIAIEQLEAERDSDVLRRTSILEKQLREAKEGGEGIAQLQQEASRSSEKTIALCAEVEELRAALTRLADERVDLKLELEESLSRLRHPDSGGQLVDRRVVRQLLVSYFRVDSVRRRDVLELMSRMLAFSEDDLITVGIKRRALMDRLGAAVQAPQFDDVVLPPVGTVSDRWIEYLLKETEGQVEEDDF
jgi:hypothetical protein